MHKSSVFAHGMILVVRFCRENQRHLSMGLLVEESMSRVTTVALETHLIIEAIPAPVLTSALCERSGSCGDADFAIKLLSAMRYEFGGHLEKAEEKPTAA